jgi:hypothetical protein
MEPAKINILLTFDYELPLGGIKGSFDDCLFEPTEKLLSLAKKKNVPLNFFADILGYEKFRSLGRTDFAIPFEKQLVAAFNSGHDIQLHLHPHWLETKIEKDKFYPSSKFGLDAYKDENGINSIEGIINSGIDALEKIIKKDSTDYKCIAYRGGGYVLNPDSDRILKALYSRGVFIDATISKGYFFKSDLSCVDYTSTPEKGNWFLSLNGDLTLENPDNKSLWEIPIASKPKSVFETPTSFKIKKYAWRAPENRGFVIHEKPVNLSIKERMKVLLSSRMLTFDNFTYKKDFPLKVLNYHINKHRKDDLLYLCAVSHPKSMGDYSFELMEYFIDQARSKYGKDVSFTTFQKVAEQKNLQPNSWRQ